MYNTKNENNDMKKKLLRCLVFAFLAFVADPVILVKPLQPLKAEEPISVTLSGIVILVSPLQL